MSFRRTATAAALLLVGLAVPARAAASCTGVPAHGSSPVVDTARVVDDGAERALAGNLEAYRRTWEASIVVLTVPSLGGRTVEDYARTVFACWGVGARSRNDGVLILLAMGERKLRIEVGTGLRDKLTDAEAAGVIEQMVPLLRSGDVSAAVTAGTALTLAEVSGADTGPQDAPQDVPRGEPAVDVDYPAFPRAEPEDLPGPPPIFPLFVLFAVVMGGLSAAARFFGVSAGRSTRGGFGTPWLSTNRYGHASGSERLPGFDHHDHGSSSFGSSGSWSGGSSFGSDSSGSSGGSSFGGGSSSGGGASGSW